MDNNRHHSEKVTTGDQSAEIVAKLHDEIARLRLELIAARPLYSRRKLEADNRLMLAALKEVEDYCTRGGDLEAMLEIVRAAILKATTSVERSPVANDQSNGR